MVQAVIEERAEFIVGVVRDTHGRCLLVRERGSNCFTSLRNKALFGEAPLDTIERTCLEVLGCKIDRESAEFDARCEAKTGNDINPAPGVAVYRISLIGAPKPSAHVEEIVWLNPNDLNGIPLDRLSKDYVLPRYKRWVKPSIAKEPSLIIPSPIRS